MSKSKKWFKKKRGSYIPCSTNGWLTYIPYIAYMASSVVVVHSQTKSISLLVYEIVPQWIAATIVITWVAQRKS
jgi:hypothetical protein